MNQLMTVQQVADYMQMSTDKVYDMAQKGEIPALKIRQQWRFDRSDIDSWLKTCLPRPAQRRQACSVQTEPKHGRRKEKRA